MAVVGVVKEAKVAAGDVKGGGIVVVPGEGPAADKPDAETTSTIPTEVEVNSMLPTKATFYRI